jgi:hypothetical protein
VRRHLAPRFIVTSILLSSAIACNAIWGIDDGTLADGTFEARPDRDGTTSSGGANTDSSDVADVNADALGDGDGPTEAGDSAGGSDGATGGMGGTGGTPPCTVCEEGKTETDTVTCGRCGTGHKSRSRMCTNCAWGPWSEYGECSQCDALPYRCCKAGYWEFCYVDGCEWTGGCEYCLDQDCRC